MNIDHQKLSTAVKKILIAAGTDSDEANAVTDHLVWANLKGHDSHGVGMLPNYIRNISVGNCLPNQHAEHVSTQGNIVVVDGKTGFGQVVGPEAMDMGIKIACNHGIAVVALKNAHHLGRIGSHAERVVKQGFISMHYVNVVGHPPQVAPFGGREKRLSTNPFCCAIPVRGQDPIVLDMATSAIAAGKVRVARNAGLPVPDDCLIDHEGRATNDPNVVIANPPGAQIHFGKHKGFGLALICEVLAGALTGAWSIQPGNERVGTTVNHMLTFILDPGYIGDIDRFTEETQALIEYLKGTPPAAGSDGILIPGEPERNSTAERLEHGIPIDDTTWEGILKTAESVQISADEIRKIISS